MPDAYKNARPAPTDLASGRVLAPGEPVLAADLKLGETEDGQPTHDQRLVDDGSLVEAILDELTGDALKQRADELNIKGRSKMSADELRAAVAAAEAEQSPPDTPTDQEGSS